LESFYRFLDTEENKKQNVYVNWKAEKEYFVEEQKYDILKKFCIVKYFIFQEKYTNKLIKISRIYFVQLHMIFEHV